MSKTIHFLRTNQKILLQIALSLLFVGLGIYFLRHERAEVGKVIEALVQADASWVMAGLGLLALFVIVQGLMYVYSFRAIGQRIGMGTASALYLKRNLISVFLPAGLLTNMLFFNEEMERKEGVTQTQTYFASSIFSVCSILSAVIVGLPALLWLLIKSQLSGELAVGILLTVASLAGLFFGVKSLVKKGAVYRFLQKKAPPFAEVIDSLETHAFHVRDFWMVVALSCVIEVIGIAHLYISIEALGGTATLQAAVIGYAIVPVVADEFAILTGCRRHRGGAVVCAHAIRIFHGRSGIHRHAVPVF